jgi:hypothetical protein
VIRVLRLWLPVIPVAMLAILLLSAMPDHRPCLVEAFFPSHECAVWGPSDAVIGPVDVHRGVPFAIEGNLWGPLFAALAVGVAIVGSRRLRALSE